METLNYHHLRLFQAVASEGNLTRASRKLHLSPQTVSSQIRGLEAALGEQLFSRAGRRLILTAAGEVALNYANEIFSLGTEMRESLSGQATDRPAKILVGATLVLPKMIVHRVLEPALDLEQPVQISSREGGITELLAELSVHRLDVVLSDSPIPPNINVRAYNHLLGTCGVSFMATPELAAELRRGFPDSLDGAPVLLASTDSVVRRDLDAWFDAKRVRPVIRGEFQDSALLKIFGQAGEGFFAVPSVIEGEVTRQYEVEAFGCADEVSENFYAISAERRVRHPAVIAICEAARAELFS